MVRAPLRAYSLARHAATVVAPSPSEHATTPIHKTSGFSVSAATPVLILRRSFFVERPSRPPAILLKVSAVPRAVALLLNHGSFPSLQMLAPERSLIAPSGVTPRFALSCFGERTARSPVERAAAKADPLSPPKMIANPRTSEVRGLLLPSGADAREMIRTSAS